MFAFHAVKFFCNHGPAAGKQLFIIPTPMHHNVNQARVRETTELKEVHEQE